MPLFKIDGSLLSTALAKIEPMAMVEAKSMLDILAKDLSPDILTQSIRIEKIRIVEIRTWKMVFQSVVIQSFMVEFFDLLTEDIRQSQKERLPVTKLFYRYREPYFLSIKNVTPILLSNLGIFLMVFHFFLAFS